MSKIQIQKLKDNKIAYVKINFPEKRNILTMEIILELTKAFSHLSKDSKLHAIILSGEGSNFCAGGDLRWLQLKEESSDLENIQEVTNLFNVFDTIYNCPIPVIGKIHGSAFGGGLGLVSVCDIAVAEKETRFCFSELKINLIPSTISPFVLKKMPSSRVKELILSARVFLSQEALDSGLIHFIGDEKQCENHVNNIISHFLSCDRIALIQAKKLIHQVSSLSSDKAREYSIQSLAERRKSPEVSKKITQFLKK